MGKYHSQVRKRITRQAEGPHPIWNTLGCLMMIIVPVMSIAGAVATLQYGLDARWPFPPVMLRPVYLPGFLLGIPGLGGLLLKLFSIDYVVGYAAIALVYVVVLGGILSVLYALLHRVAGPPRYSPLDAPPINTKGKQYRR